MNVRRRTLAFAFSLLLLSPSWLVAQGIRGELRVRGDVVGFQRLTEDGFETENVYPLYQDLRAVGWAGVEGLSFHTQIRGRLGSDDAWPRTEQEVEAITRAFR